MAQRRPATLPLPSAKKLFERLSGFFAVRRSEDPGDISAWIRPHLTHTGNSERFRRVTVRPRTL
jgi:hypothetical protein